MTPHNFQSATFQEITGVTDDVLDRLTVYAAILSKWQAKINLVGSATLPDLWSRHMLDSAQLAPLIPPCARVVDMGSGAGFPGLVLAIMDTGDNGHQNRREYHLVESDQRKCTFLREVNRETRAGVSVHNARIEALDSLKADVMTSRALAPLDKLLFWAEKHLLSTGKGIYPKGRRWGEELTAAQKDWTMTVRDYPSQTDPSGRILELGEIHRRYPRI